MNMRKLAIVLGVLAMTSAVQAAVMNYQLRVNGQIVTHQINGIPTVDYTNKTQLGIEAGVPFTLNVLVKTDAHTATGAARGVLQFAFNLDSAGGLTPSAQMYCNDYGHLLPVRTFDGYTIWDATTPADFGTFYPGYLNADGHLVLEQMGCINQNYFNVPPYRAKYGAGVFSEISTGTMTWDGSATTLNVYGYTDHNGVWDAYSPNHIWQPTAVNGYAINFMVPEPVSMSLLALGSLAIIRRRRN